MSSSSLGLLIGGIIPALLFGFSNIFVKSSTENGISPGMYLLCVSAAVCIAGLVSIFSSGDSTISGSSGLFAFLAGLLWAMGIFSLTLALNKYHAPIAQLTPLFNMNTLVAVLIGLWVFSEWKEVESLQLIVGTVLITVGGILVARA